jgi:hypothetical protein
MGGLNRKQYFGSMGAGLGARAIRGAFSASSVKNHQQVLRN